MTRALSWGALALVTVAALAYGTVDEGPARSTEDRVQAVAATIRCPQCRSQSAADSDAPTAFAVRNEIAERVDAGESDAEIRAYFASTYGDQILLTPPAEGVGSLVWVLPVVAAVLGAAGLGWAFVRWRRWS
jgi:cytochrome c-type biogenesis protein CcmH/NrfF